MEGHVELSLLADGRPVVAEVTLAAAAGGTVWISSRDHGAADQDARDERASDQGSRASLTTVGLMDSPASARSNPASMLAVTVHRCHPPTATMLTPSQGEEAGEEGHVRQGRPLRPGQTGRGEDQVKNSEWLFICLTLCRWGTTRTPSGSSRAPCTSGATPGRSWSSR